MRCAGCTSTTASNSSQAETLGSQRANLSRVNSWLYLLYIHALGRVNRAGHGHHGQHQQESPHPHFFDLTSSVPSRATRVGGRRPIFGFQFHPGWRTGRLVRLDCDIIVRCQTSVATWRSSPAPRHPPTTRKFTPLWRTWFVVP